HGGGAFSGKDPPQVDRPAASALRSVARHVAAAALARRCEGQVAYAIGEAQPVGLYVEAFRTEPVDPAPIEAAVRGAFDLRPAAIPHHLALPRPASPATPAYRPFGR
ncbi:methionine adenosyltransferase domain-containing protein, partial [Isoptericola haloaureus]